MVIKLIKLVFGYLTCGKHEYIHVRNIHGDEIIALNFKRSEWECKKCGYGKLRDQLYYEEEYKHE